ncbi:MAG: 23S rRNA (pseudouridine(1915)-N(3))-methyltransferase RlmH [Methanosarcinales archaeon]|nr:23S rRNA (pseudouridine(1915)-N(3))-methyltransferase RlmH [Methanosarcinales archaeon]
MIIKIVAVGKLRERFWQEGVADYARRLGAYARLEVIEVPETRVEGEAPAGVERVLAREGDAIRRKLRSREGGLVVALDRQGKAMASLDLAAWMEQKTLEGVKEITWIIGGPLGLDPALLEQADLLLSFSSLTFPHQMMRLMLLEQLYRCFKIMKNEPYHH